MNISTTELFHFTKFENLKSIIHSKSFLPRYILEYIHLSNNYLRNAAFPLVAMVCFCDIPLELSEKHRNRYGKTAIAMTEVWKLKKGLNPVFYIQSNSDIAKVFADFANIITNSFLKIIEESNELRIKKILGDIALNQNRLTYFIKQYENNEEIEINYNDRKRVFEKRRFYDEKEWRFVPFEAQKYNELFIHITDYDNPQKLNEKNKCIEKYRLTFDYEDIEFLIVSNQDEKLELEKIIKEIYNKEIEIKILE